VSTIKNIAVLTSGGDAPGMNKAVHKLVQLAMNNNMKPFVVLGGYKGLYEDQIKEADIKKVETFSNVSGTSILTSRFPEFENEEIRKIAAGNLKKKNIDVLFVIGGNGSYLGAEKLSELGIKVICLPGTIDNDICSSNTTIGFNSALEVIIDTIDNLKTTSFSHQNIIIIETMGRDCPDLTLMAAYATKVDYIVTKNNIITTEKFIEIAKKLLEKGKRSITFLVSEKIYGKNNLDSIEKIAELIEKETSKKTKFHLTGFTQRGAHTIPFDRILATRLSIFAFKCMMDNIFNISVGIREDELGYMDIHEANSLCDVKKNNTIIEINQINEINSI
jgi:6-phosphofructokinase 1